MQRPDLEEVLTFYGVIYNPNKSGEQAVLCPAHDERNPSCRLNLGSGLMFCNSCDFKGSSIDLIIAKEGVDYGAAIDFAKRFSGSGDSRPIEQTERREGRRGGYRPAISRRRGMGSRPWE